MKQHDRTPQGTTPRNPPRGESGDTSLTGPAEPMAGGSATDSGTNASRGQTDISRQERGNAASANNPSRDSASVDSGRHAGQEGDRIDAELRNISEGYGGPKIKEDRGTPRRVARDEGQLDK
jgi:hypothetical protein